MKDNPRPWHARDAGETLRALEASESGLSTREAAHRLERHGPNTLPARRRRGPLRRFLAQFDNLLIYVLLAAAAVTAGLRHWVDTGVILGVVLINAVIGFLQEGKAEHALDAIAQMLSPQARVLRDGRRRTVAAADLVPGDVVELASGDKVPADLRLLRVRSLQTQEAALTGESLAVDKATEPVTPDAALGDRACVAFSGTLVTYGRGAGVVVATGKDTEIGRISEMLAGVRTLTTPLLQQMAVFGRWLTGAILALAAVAFAFGVWLRGYEAAEMFLAAVGLAVAAIPEGLPAIMTITLAIGVAGMARECAIIRRLPAVETLGAVTVICSDKTGTLTRNELSVQHVATPTADYTVSGSGYRPDGRISMNGQPIDPREAPELLAAVRAGLLCNDGELRAEADGEWEVEGTPVDGALLTLGLKAGLEKEGLDSAFARLDAIPFESAHKYMATLHAAEHGHGHGIAYIKGAPERILDLCEDSIDRDAWEQRIEALAAAGYRTIAVASREFPKHASALSFPEVEAGGFALLGVFGLLDPSREEAIAAVEACREAGIGVKMITGDHASTARAVARQLGVPGEAEVLTGRRLDAMSDAELADAVRKVDVYARTTPEHKLRLVQALQSHGEVVAMTGDGVNDAPALKRADVGIAMGRRGTEAAKEAAEMVLADDNFASIAKAVRAGRTVYDNLKKAILFILPTNGGEALTILIAILLGTTLPITPVQILWVNMITAVTLALALAFEGAEPDVMARPPRRRDEPILSRFLVWRIVMVSVLLVAATFGLFQLARENGASLEEARTIAVNMLVAGEIVYLFNSRVIHGPAWTREALKSSGPAQLSVAVVVAFQMLLTYWSGMHMLFGTAAIGANDWLRIVGAALLLFFIVEAEKAIFRRAALRHRRRMRLTSAGAR